MKLVGGVVPNTPSGRREHEQFTTYEAHRTNFIVRVCTVYVDFLKLIHSWQVAVAQAIILI